MAKFEEGNDKGRKIDGEVAAEYQKRSAEARKANRTIREALLAELDKVDDASGLTRRQILIKKAMANHAKGKLSFKDLKDLQDLLGESEQTLNIKTDPAIVPMDAQALEALSKWASKEGGKE